jgi:hypothetical protein
MLNSPKRVLAKILTSFLEDGGSHYWSDTLPEIRPMPGNCELKEPDPNREVFVAWHWAFLF